MNTKILIAAAIATVALGVDAASANSGWDLSRITESAPQPRAQAAHNPTPAQRAAQVPASTLQFYAGWTYGNG